MDPRPQRPGSQAIEERQPVPLATARRSRVHPRRRHAISSMDEAPRQPADAQGCQAEDRWDGRGCLAIRAMGEGERVTEIVSRWGVGAGSSRGIATKPRPITRLEPRPPSTGHPSSCSLLTPILTVDGRIVDDSTGRLGLRPVGRNRLHVIGRGCRTTGLVDGGGWGYPGTGPTRCSSNPAPPPSEISPTDHPAPPVDLIGHPVDRSMWPIEKSPGRSLPVIRSISLGRTCFLPTQAVPLCSGGFG